MDTLLHHLVRSSASRRADKIALIDRTRTFTYEELYATIESFGASLRHAGVGPGDRVGVFLDPGADQVVAIFAVAAAGGVVVPLYKALVPEQVAHVGRDSAMVGLVTTRDRLLQLRGANAIPSLRFAVTRGPSAAAQHFAFDDFVNAKLTLGPDVRISVDLAAILYTSGSTGKPKGVMLSHKNLLAGSEIVSTYLEITERDRILAALPLSFDAGLNQVLTAFHRGGTAIAIDYLFAHEIVETIERERVTGLAGVPTLWSLLVQPSSRMDRADVSSMRYVTNTGGAMPEVVLAELRRVLPKARVYLMYGLTEAFRSTYLSPDQLDQRPTSIGKAIPDTEILVVHESGRLARPHEQGELVHRGPTVSLGYWGNREATDAVLRPHPFAPPELLGSEKVCYSGDLVTQDEEGFLYFVGRRDALIKSSGHRISPTEIEEVLYQTGSVRAAAAIGLPDAILGQAIHVFVVPNEGYKVDENALLAYCADRLPRHMVPKAVEALDDLPRTPSGKPDYPALRARKR